MGLLYYWGLELVAPAQEYLLQQPLYIFQCGMAQALVLHLEGD